MQFVMVQTAQQLHLVFSVTMMRIEKTPINLRAMTVVHISQRQRAVCWLCVRACIHDPTLRYVAVCVSVYKMFVAQYCSLANVRYDPGSPMIFHEIQKHYNYFNLPFYIYIQHHLSQNRVNK